MAKRTVHIPDALDAQSEDAAWTLRLSFSALVTRALNSYLNVEAPAPVTPRLQEESECISEPQIKIPRRAKSRT